MNARDDLLRELADVPEPVLLDVLAFLKSRKHHVTATTLLAESTLAEDWLRSEEDAAWADL
ncbi:MAG: DUF2281 domain-containing protein [Euryarchaeota archaeon]|nr:DUF2281 domain-containing protein [Euryarchaeota archaeon]